MYKSTWLINVEDFWDKKNDFKEDRWEICFYCKICLKMVDIERASDEEYIFKCKECGSQDIAIWTLEWLKSNYKI